jgi:hypothetical protein
MIKHTLALIIAVTLAGCSSGQGLSNIHMGMTKQQVIESLGTPTSVHAQGGAEVLEYRLYAGFTSNPWYQTYLVGLVNNKVVRYGQPSGSRS